VKIAVKWTLLVLLAGISLCAVPSVRGEGFQPISPEELKMQSEPLAPGAPAIILQRRVDRDDNGRTSHENNYFRIKILTEEGRKYADVEIPFVKENAKVVGIRARTIRPDGSVADFNGQVYEKTLVKARGLRYLAKTFTLPDVRVGSILEYFYTFDLTEYYIPDSHWILSQELFTREVQFSLKPYKSSYIPVNLRWIWQGLAPGTAPKEGPDHIIRMEAKNIPAFQEEDFMPPPNELKSRVDFIYDVDAFETDPVKFWTRTGKKWNGRLESFVGKRKAMEEAVRQIVSPSDPPEIKLRKIYDRVQQIRNTSYEVRKTEQEQKRDKEKSADNVEEVWKRGYGDGVQLTWLFLGLARAAGFDAYGCWVSDRREYFFQTNTMQSGKLNANVVLVKIGGKDVYFDPGAAFAPYGMLPWVETGTVGLRMDKDGGTWIRTTLPQSTESQVHRTASFKLSDSGDLEGKLTATYTGLEAMYRRVEVRNDDEVARKKFLEEQVKAQVPVAAEADLTNKPDWSSSETPLVAEFDVKIPGWASPAGRRVVFPAAIFAAHEKHVFEHANRVHPVYFEYPYEILDDVSIELPPGWQVGSVPKPQTKDGHVIVYDLKIEDNKDNVHITRQLNVDVLLLEQKYYPALRNFFQVVRSGDEEQIVVQTGAASASN
jgi:transglutaminase-like putative cysteine protease